MDKLFHSPLINNNGNIITMKKNINYTKEIFFV